MDKHVVLAGEYFKYRSEPLFLLVSRHIGATTLESKQRSEKMKLKNKVDAFRNQQLAIGHAFWDVHPRLSLITSPTK